MGVWVRVRLFTKSALIRPSGPPSPASGRRAPDKSLNKTDMPNTPDTSHATMTPREIVPQLHRHHVGKPQANRAVAIEPRNRWRRAQLDDAPRHEVKHQKPLLIGQTGVGLR